MGGQGGTGGEQPGSCSWKGVRVDRMEVYYRSVRKPHVKAVIQKCGSP